MQNPIHYFEELFSYDQSQEKKEKLIFHETEYWQGEVIKIDHAKGLITVRSVEQDESTGKLMNGTATISFFNSFESEINVKSKLLKKYILEKTLEISSTGVSSETFLQQISSKINLYKQKSDLFYSNYPFVKLQIEDLSHFVSEQLPKSEIPKPPISKKTLIATPVQANNTIPISETPHHHKHAFNWDGFEEEEKITQIKKLYQLLLQAPPVISADEEDFIRAFTQQNVTAGISWLLEGKSRLTSIASMCYLVHKLGEEGFIEDFPPTDFGKKLNYVFRDKDGMELKPGSLKSSLSDFRKTFTCDHSERLDDIIDEILK